MVFYFTAKDGTVIYMGRDKHENEVLIEHGRPTDLWFHVDKLSSAHVYLRLKDGQSWESIPKETLTECCQLVKHNSIQGSKTKELAIVYTPWENLKKTSDMVTGQIGFHKSKAVIRVGGVRKDADVLKRINKTVREEETEHFIRDKEEWVKEKRREERIRNEQRRREEKELATEREKQKQLRSYAGIMDTDEFKESAQELGSKYANFEDYEDDFM